MNSFFKRIGTQLDFLWIFSLTWRLMGKGLFPHLLVLYTVANVSLRRLQKFILEIKWISCNICCVFIGETSFFALFVVYAKVYFLFVCFLSRPSPPGLECEFQAIVGTISVCFDPPSSCFVMKSLRSLVPIQTCLELEPELGNSNWIRIINSD